MSPERLPSRVSQHSSKTESHRRVGALFPDNWTDDEPSEDYGIDFLVELFDGAVPTGLRFGIQVKSTARLRGSPKTQIRWATRNYWHQQDFPVLVVLWDRATETAWWGWSHRFDATGLDEEREKFQFTFPKDQRWAADTPAAIEREVRARRAWEAPGAHLPLPLVVQDEVGVAGLAPRELAAALRSWLAPFPTLVQIRATANKPLFLTVEATRSRVTIWMSGTTSGSFHYPDFAEPATAEEREARAKAVAADVVLGIVDRLGYARLLAEAARIAASVVTASGFIKVDPDLVSRMIGLLGSQGRVGDAIGLLDHVMRFGTADTVGAALGTFMAGVDELEDRERNELIGWLLGTADAHADLGTREGRVRAAELTFNAGTFTGLRQPDAAADLLDRAGVLNGELERAGHFQRTLGLFRFAAGHHAAAATHLQRAADLGEEPVLGSLGDAYMWAGEYEDALRCFERAAAGTESNSDWRLKAWCLSRLIERFGISRQDRSIDEAARIAETEREADDLERCLRLDLLCAEGLYRYGGVKFHASEPAVDLVIAAALVRPRDPRRWIGAANAALREDPDLTHDVLESAAHACNEDLVALLSQAGEPPEVLEAMQNTIDEMRAASLGARSIPWMESDR